MSVELTYDSADSNISLDNYFIQLELTQDAELSHFDKNSLQ